MPLYTYTCDRHGEFSAWGKMGDAPSFGGGGCCGDGACVY